MFGRPPAIMSASDVAVVRQALQQGSRSSGGAQISGRDRERAGLVEPYKTEQTEDAAESWTGRRCRDGPQPGEDVVVADVSKDQVGVVQRRLHAAAQRPLAGADDSACTYGSEQQ